MAAPAIVVTLSTFSAESPEPLRLLEASGRGFRVNPHGRRLSPPEVIELADGAAAVIAGVEPYDAATLAALPALRCISRCGAGVDNVDLQEAARRGIRVLNTPDAPTDAVAELAIGMMLGLLRLLPETTADMRRGVWQRRTGRLLAERVVGIVGLGRIGRRVVDLLRPFRVQVLGCDPHPDPAWAAAAGVRMVSLPELLAGSDIVALHAAGSRETPLRIGPSEIAAMRPGAYLLNLARGSMVDDVAVAAALESGRLAGAAFDVFPEEPYAGPLCRSPRTILSPHQATLTVETRAAMEVGAVRNALEFLDAMADTDQ
jgi:D-3-phosphoglycerate dehydrogenase / 2-oxoglutarate reductase